MRKLVQIFAIIMAMSLQLAAQERFISGKVTSKDDGTTIPGVSITVVGSAIGTSTDIDGKYRLSVPPNAKSIRFSGVGVKTKEVALGSSTTVDIVMESDVLKLDEAVVTAIGIKREKKALGYSVQDVSGDALTKGNQGDVLQALSGKVAGVQITAGSGAPGASTNIKLRGANSILFNNQPLFVIDGIPVDNSVYTSGNPENGDNNFLDGVGNSNRAADVNPEDIESITVLKGGAATALYGINAGNGAIIITTKKGARAVGGNKINVSFSSSLSFETVNRFVETQKKYGQGSRYDEYGSELYEASPFIYGSDDPVFGKRISWGPAIDQLSYNGDASYLWDSRGKIVFSSDPSATSKVVAYDQNDFFQTGTIWNNNVSITGGSDIGTYRFSLSNLKNDGVIPLSSFRRTVLSMGGQSAINTKMKISGNISYSNSGGQRIQQGSNTSGLMLGLLRTPITFDNRNGVSDPEDPAAFVFGDGRPRTYRGFGGYDNPYWTINRNPYKDEVNRVFGNVQTDYLFNNWLTATYRIGGDIYSDERNAAFDKYSATASSGRIINDQYNFKQFNSDLLLTAQGRLSNTLNGSLTIGNNIQKTKVNRLYVQGDGLTIPTFFNLNNVQSVVSYYRPIDSKASYSFYGDAKIDFKSYLYLGVTGRVDNVSTLAPDKNTFFYPGASLGFIFTDAFGMENNKFLPYGKVRVSHAKVGNAAPAFALQTYYGSASVADGWVSGVYFPFNGTTGFTQLDTYGNNNLKPENTVETELGTDLRFFNNRVGLDFTYYKRNGKDLIVPVSIAASTGGLAAYLNTGEIENKGIEIALNITPVKTKSFEWNIGLNWSKNKSKVLKLADGLEQIFLNGFEGTSISAVEGQPYGVIWGFKYLEDGNGNLILNDDPTVPDDVNDTENPLFALPLANTESEVIGDPNPDWIGGVSNTFTWKGFSLYVLIDIKHGGDIWNGTKGALTYFGTSKLTENRGSSVVYEGLMGHLDGDGNIVHYENGVEVAGPGAANTTAAELGEYWYSTEGGGFGTTSKQFVEDGSYTKLRELSLSYSFNPTLLKKSPFRSFELGVFARNIIIDTDYDGVDPETSLTGAGNSQGLDYFNMPNTKSFGVSLKVGF